MKSHASPAIWPGQTARMDSTTSHDFHDFQAVPGGQLAPGEFRRRDCLAVVLDYHAARQKTLRQQKLFETAGNSRHDLLPVGGDEGMAHFLDPIIHASTMRRPT